MMMVMIIIKLTRIIMMMGMIREPVAQTNIIINAFKQPPSSSTKGSSMPAFLPSTSTPWIRNSAQYYSRSGDIAYGGCSYAVEDSDD